MTTTVLAEMRRKEVMEMAKMSDKMREIKVAGNLRMAALLERQADDQEWRAPLASRRGQYAYFESLERMDNMRAKARQLRAEAADWQREGNNTTTKN